MTTHPTEDLGLYPLGLLEGEERAGIERHLAPCEKCRAELRAHEATVAALADGAARPAPQSLRDAIVARHARTPWFALSRVAFAASLVVAVAAAALLVTTRAELERERALRDEYARVVGAVAEGARVVTLEARGTPGRGVLVVPRSRGAYLILDLPAPPAGKVYEAWVIRGGTAMPAGLAPARAGIVTLALTAEVRPGDVAAVTLEIAGGVDRPTTDPVLAGGL